MQFLLFLLAIVIKLAVMSNEHFITSIGREGNIYIYDCVKLQHIHTFDKVHRGKRINTTF